jgi:gamma-glutamyltranspeptidase/glutathione hydrolase
LVLALVLAACESEITPGVIGTVEGFAGAVVADEPRAATIGRDVLSAGGSAADAAVATYFALAVTMPSTAGLGGGGVCLAHDYETGETVAIDFLPRAAGDVRVAVPANVRGMAALHARFGMLPWAQLIGNAESLARFGTPMSRALAKELETIGPGLLSDPEMALVFGNGTGELLGEGENLVQAQLAGTLARLRQNGGGELYVGQFARTFADSAQAIGAPLTMQSLQASVPQIAPAVGLEVGYHLLYVPNPPAAGGITTAQMVGMIASEGGFDDSESARARLLAQASQRAFLDRHGWLGPGGTASVATAELLSPARIEAMAAAGGSSAAVAEAFENSWATGFVTADRTGDMVACGVTMNALFGARRMVPGTGIILAPGPNDEGTDFYALGPVILANPNNKHAYFAGAASGGEAGISALASVFLRVSEAEEELGAAMLAKRLHHNGVPDTLFYETGLDPGALAAAQQSAGSATPVPVLGRVNAIWCPDTLRNKPETCRAAADPRTFGLAIVLAE